MNEKQALYAVIPARVLYDDQLPPNAKLVYAEIAALATRDGYCTAWNQHFSELFGLAVDTVSRLIGKLQDRGHITTDVTRDPHTRQVTGRKIWITGAPGIALPPPGNISGTSRTKKQDPPGQKAGERIYTEDYNNPPNPPEGGGAEAEQKPKRKRKRVDPSKLIPTWQPERFTGFWAAYPRGNDKARAVEEWDKLPQDKKLMEAHGGDETALLNAIAKGLGRQLKCRQWQEGVGIPYAFRWLRDRKWTEAPDKGSDPAGLAQLAGETPQEAPAERPYHIEVQDGEEVVIYDD